MEKKEKVAAPKKAAAKKEAQKVASKPLNLAQAIIQVMNEVKGIEKGLTVGSGNHSYKGVADKDVKKTIGDAMVRAGLCLLPISIEPTLKVERWEEVQNWNGKESVKRKQSVFSEVLTKYKLMHENGEYEIIMGYGHGVDSMDKAAGKATTYALKYAMLYAFLVPTGDIDDSDAKHSNEIEAPKAPLPILTDGQFTKALHAIDKGEYSKAELVKNYKLNKAQIEDLKKLK